MAHSIGTLNEGGLHAALKRWLARPGDRFEEPVDGYVVDVVRGDLLIEIQTGGCAPLKRKLADLLERHRVRLVVPIARRRTVQLDGMPQRARRTKTSDGRIEDLFERLVSIPTLIGHERFELLIIETVEIEHRTRTRTRTRSRRKAWTVADRELVDVLEQNLIRDARDLAALLPAALPARFSTADVARLAGIARTTAQQMLYCLRATGAVSVVARDGNAHIYERC